MKSGWQSWTQKESAKDPLFWVKLNLKRRYGITLDDLHKMERAQGGRCAICDEKPKKGRLVVDHDHVTGRVRGLLCRSCNYCLGGFRDSTDLVARALKYLRRAERKS